MEKIVYKGGKQSFHTNKKMKNDQKLQSTKEQASLHTQMHSQYSVPLLQRIFRDIFTNV